MGAVFVVPSGLWWCTNSVDAIVILSLVTTNWYVILQPGCLHGSKI
jgi:hypothetical protein